MVCAMLYPVRAEASTWLASDEYFASEFVERSDAGIVDPLGVADILGVGRGDHPLRASRPAGLMTVAFEALTFDTMIVPGRQFISPSFLRAWAPNLGVVKKITASGLEDFSLDDAGFDLTVRPLHSSPP